jgi:hypothetical protein
MSTFSYLNIVPQFEEPSDLVYAQLEAKIFAEFVVVR